MSKTVLIIDDDKLARKSLTSLLANDSLNLIEAENGAEGLKAALDSRPDLIVTDIHMPEMDGLTMVEELRKDQWGQSVPVIILTADEGMDIINQALSAGVTVYLTKVGVDSRMLADQVVTALG